MPSLTHDALLQLFRNRPTLAPELLRDALHTAVPAFDHVARTVRPLPRRSSWRRGSVATRTSAGHGRYI
jgi:hypothetical protein